MSNHFPTFQRISNNLNPGPSFEFRACRLGLRALLILSAFAFAGFYVYQDRHFASPFGPMAAFNQAIFSQLGGPGQPRNQPITHFEVFAWYVLSGFGSPANCLLVGTICLLGLMLISDPARDRPQVLQPAPPHRPLSTPAPPPAPASPAFPPEPPMFRPPH